MPVNSGKNNVINTRTNEFSAYAVFVVLFLANYFIHSSIYSVFLLIIAACLIIRYKPILMIVPCMLSDTLQGYFMITDTLSFNRALAILFVIGCFVHYRRIRITKFSFIPIILSLYLLASGLWSVTGSFNDAIAFLISMAMLILMESFEDVNRYDFYRLFNTSFILYGLLLALLTFIKAGGLNVSQVVFDEELTKIWFDRQDKRGLNQFCKDLGIVKFDLTNIDEKLKEDNQFLSYIHHILNEIRIEEGALICPNCGREYLINKGIINYNLNDDEI